MISLPLIHKVCRNKSRSVGLCILLLGCGCERTQQQTSQVLGTTASERPAEVPGATSAAVDGFLSNELQRVSPKADGWDTEVFYDEIKPVFYKLAAELGKNGAWDTATLAELCVPELSVSALRPQELTSRLINGFTVRRASETMPLPARRQDLLPAARGMLAAFLPGRPVDFHVKIFRVTLTGNEGTATAYLDAAGTTRQGFLQQNSTWETRWTRSTKDKDAAWRVAEIRLTDFEEVESATDTRLFAECTLAVLGKTEAWKDQLRYSLDHWRTRIETSFGVEPGGLAGLAVGDANGDGLEDLFYCDYAGLLKRLFLHQPDGSLKDVTKEAGVDFIDLVRAAAFADFDNDGDQDLAVSFNKGIIFLSNDGNAHFTTAATVYAEPIVHSLAVADYDRDGRLDLYACSYIRDFTSFGEEGVPVPWYDANNGSPNSLFKSEGDWKFSNVTQETGLNVNNRKYSLAASWDDFDNDGWPDLYVANDFGRNNLYRNDRGRFTDVAVVAGADDPAPGMACSWGDVNNDGFMDIHVSNMFSGAGNRITTQVRYKAGSPPDVLAGYQRFARGNTLLINNRNGTFSDQSEALQITLGRWAWGNQIADVNNDGWPDLLTGNGFITGPIQDDL